MVKPNRSGLGRGLDALFVSSETATSRKEESRPAPAAAPAAPRELIDGEDVLQEVEAAQAVEAARDAAAAAAQAAHTAQIAQVLGTPAPEPAPEEGQKPAVEDIPAAEPDETAASEPETEPQPLAGEALADSIDVTFSLSEPEIVERAPRKAAEPAPAPVPAAIPVAAAVTPAIMDGAIAEIALELLEPNPYQPRLKFKQDALDELAASIARDGLVSPITVRPLPGGRFQIIAGERRWRAAQIAGMRSVPAYIREVADRELGELALVENLQREDLNPIEAAIGYRTLMKQQNLTQSELAQLLCKGRSTIANTLRLLDLSEDLQELIYNEQLTEGHARAIQQVQNPELRKKLAERVMAEGLSVRATESLARLMSGGKPEGEGERAKRASLPVVFKTMQNALKQRLGTNVKVRNVGGKNRIEIEFADAEDLERICRHIVEAEQ